MQLLTSQVSIPEAEEAESFVTTVPYSDHVTVSEEYGNPTTASQSNLSPADERLKRLAFPPESTGRSGIVSEPIDGNDVLSAAANTLESLRLIWHIPPLGEAAIFPTTLDFIDRVRYVEQAAVGVYHVHCALQSTNSGVLAQVGKSWQIATSKSAFGDIPSKDVPSIVGKSTEVKYRELGTHSAWELIYLYKEGLWEERCAEDKQQDLNGVLRNTGFVNYTRPLRDSGYLSDQDVWTLAWGIVQCACVTALRPPNPPDWKLGSTK